MSTAGQAVGGIVGAFVGFYVGGPTGAIYGAQIGITAGGLLDPPKGPTVSGPRLSDLSFQTSTYGAPLVRCYGTVPIVGNIFWLENNALKEVVKKTKTGGKGGPSTTTKTYSYFATFAVSLCDTSKTGPIIGIRRIWIGNVLYYNAGGNDLETVLASNRNIEGVKLYTGTSTQAPDTRMQAAIGVTDCPAYRNTAYLVFYDLPLDKWGNSLQAAQVKVEMITYHVTDSPLLLREDTIDASAAVFSISWYMRPERAVVWLPQFDTTVPQPNESMLRREVTTGGVNFAVGIGGLSYINSIGMGITDRPDAKFTDAYVAGCPYNLSGTNGRFIEKNGKYYGVNITSGYPNARVLSKASGAWISLVVPGVVAIAVDDGGNIFAVNSTNIYKYDGALNLLANASITAAGESYTLQYVYLCWDNGTLYLGFNNSYINIYTIPDDLSGITSSFTIPDFPGAEDGQSQITVVDGIVTRFVAQQSLHQAVVQRWKIPVPNSTPQPLADIVSAELQLASVITTGDIDVSLLTASVRGYRIPGGSIRSALAYLQGAYPFDLIPRGYKIKAVPRGQSSVAAINIGSLGAVSGNTLPDVVLDGPTREMDAQLPRKMVIRHLDASRDYDINEQSQERIATDSVNIETQDMPLVLTANEAAGIAQSLLYLRWLERESYAFTLPPTYNVLEPSDVVTLITSYGSIPLRLLEIRYGADGLLNCAAKPDAPALYTPNAAGGGAGTTSAGGSISLAGSVSLLLLDTPLLRADLDSPGFGAVMYAATASWHGGVAYRSIDGQTFDDVQAFSGPGTLGIARNTLSAFDSYIIERSMSLTVDFVSGTPSSMTETQILSGYNYFAYGADGRWEVIAAANASLQSDGSYVMSTFLRGLMGTEFAGALHAVGDYVVALSDPDNGWIASALSEVGIARTWRPVSDGGSVDTAANQSFSYGGVNLKPLSPVYIRADRNSSNDALIKWIRRARSNFEWLDNIDVPLDESSESYVVEIYNGATLLRTLTTTTNSVTYTGAQQVTDFGSAQSGISVKVYQVSSRIGRGYAGVATV